MNATGTSKRGIAWPMAVLTSLFFLWGFITVMNDVLVPHWKALFALSYFEGSLVQFCFYGAYFIGSLAYYFIARSSGDPIARIGYKRGLIIGLVVSAIGCGLFAPASLLHSYGAHLVALFILGIGFTVLQIAANPFVIIIGDSEGASSRLNLAQAFNSLGTTLAPLIGGYLIFKHATPDAAVRVPYLGLAGVLLLVAVLVYYTALPEPPHVTATAKSDALRHPHLRFGMIAIFCYVGAEVAIGSLIINFLGTAEVLNLKKTEADHFLSLYWGGAMAGRFLGAFALTRDRSLLRRVLSMAIIAVAMFVLLYTLNENDRFTLKNIWPMAILIAANMGTFLLVGPRPARALGLFAIIASVLLMVTVATTGAWAMWAVLAIGLFNSIMWSNIFALAIDGLGDETAQGSSLLVMMILGGALVLPLQALIADSGVGLHRSFLLPVLCYAYLAWYGFKGSQHPPVRT